MTRLSARNPGRRLHQTKGRVGIPLFETINFETDRRVFADKIDDSKSQRRMADGVECSIQTTLEYPG